MKKDPMSNFKDLHYQKEPLLICNVWDVPSAKAAEELGYKALGTSSAAMAEMLGYNDGEQMPFTDLLFMVRKLLTNTTLPLSVDIESGYSRDSKEIASNIYQLAELGVVGINIEDTFIHDKRQFLDCQHFALMLSEVKTYLLQKNVDVFLNVRTDSFLLGVSHPLEEALNRIKLYENAGAAGIFIPCIEEPGDIRAAVSSTSLPINVMCMPNLPDFNQLKLLGVARISMGNFVHRASIRKLNYYLQGLQEQQSFKSLFV
ncbi:MAG: isocitrate lyase/phosphoenolpyruvate mutase family protein [Bacteroidota bacterium]